MNKIKQNGVGEHSRLRPARSHFTWKKDEAVQLRIGKEGVSARAPETVIDLFSSVVEKYPNNIAMIQNVGKSVDVYTYKQYYHNVICIAKVFIKLGLEPFGGVAIIGFNSPQWFISHLAAIFAGALSVGVYTSNNEETCQYILNNSACNIAVVENQLQLDKILAIRHKVPSLKAVVMWSGELSSPVKGVYTWTDLFKIETDEDTLKGRLKNIYPNQCCSLIYTSGTTGTPKGVMISHDNITWICSLVKLFLNNGQRMPPDVGVSYLPLSHVAGLLLDVYCPMATGGGTVYFADANAFKGTLFKTLKEAKPTIFFGVPRVWEKLKEVLENILEESNILKKGMIAWAQDLGLVASVDSSYGLDKPIGYDLASHMVFEEMREEMGLERCRATMVGAAPMKKDVSQFYNSIGMPLMNFYGLSETTGPVTFSASHCYRVGTTGKVMDGMEVKIVTREQAAIVNGYQEGEICMRGRNMFMGYLEREEASKEMFDEEGYILSGDLGYLDSDSFLVVSGRIKELIITSGGENVAPLPIEERLLKKFNFFSNCMLIGEKRNFLSVLFTFKVDADSKTQEPTSTLAKSAVDWLKKMKVNAKLVEDAVSGLTKKARDEIDEGIMEVNKDAASRACTVKKWSILPREFSVKSGELGPTMKLKRGVVRDMYEEIISDMYGCGIGE